VHSLLPEGAWDWFCVDRIPYHGRMLTIAWDRTGERYGNGAGLSIAVNGEHVATAPDLRPLTAELI
jgi:hypothetical protein